MKNIVTGMYSETYDLNTAVGEISLLGIHTPQASTLKTMFKGFFEQYKKYKINGCNLRMVCASKQELSPELMGFTAGKVSPRDVLNPILFKACTGEGMNVLLDQIYNESLATTDSYSITQGHKNSVSEHIDNRAVAVNAYYQMLADPTWRKSHPQAGLNIQGLVPMVHKVVTTQPFKWVGHRSNGYDIPVARSGGSGDPGSTAGTVLGFGSPSGTTAAVDQSTDVAGGSKAVNPSVFVSDGITDMPWLPTATEFIGYGRKTYNDTTAQKTSRYWLVNNVPRVYMGCIVMPPAEVQPLYMRLQIDWSISWKDFRPAIELTGLDGVSDIPDDLTTLGEPENTVGSTYWNLYHTPSSKVADFGKEESSFTTTEETQVEQIMEQVA